MCCVVIVSLKNPVDSTKQSQWFPYFFHWSPSLSDYISAEAAKILRLLHVRELRELQDQINMAIVRVQELIANPKTDTKLGKVGIGK